MVGGLMSGSAQVRLGGARIFRAVEMLGVKDWIALGKPFCRPPVQLPTAHL